MAEGKEIVIRILNESGEKKEKTADVTGEDQKKSTDDLGEVVGKLAYKGAKQLGGTIVREAKYQLNMYFQMTDNYLGQQNMEIALGIADRVYSIVSSIGAGALAGAKAGPVGAAVGAAVAATTSLLTLGLQIAHNYKQEAIKIRQMDASLQFNRQRAGFSLTAGSIGENR